MSKTKGTYYGPVGRCIYCLSDTKPLTDEHIVPAGLGGNIILVDASCGDCQCEINKHIENLCMKRMFRDIRYRRKLGTRRVRKRPKVLRQQELTSWDGDISNVQPPAKSPEGSWEWRDVPYEKHLSLLVLARFKPAGFLRGLSQQASMADAFLGNWILSELSETEPQNPVYVETEFSIPAFAKLIAKIAHAYAVFRHGVEGFDPFLADFILGKDFPYPFYFIGGEARVEPREKCPWHLMDSRLVGTRPVVGNIWVPRQQPILVRVRIFADLGAPIYQAIVGKYRHDRARLKPYERLTRK